MMKNKKIIISSILVVLFVILSILVKLNLIEKFDNLVYNLITFKMNDHITLFYKIITFLGSTSFIVSLCIIFFIVFLFLKKKHISYIVPSVLIISTLLNSILKVIFRRDRPDVLKLVIEDSFSYPSGHTMASVSMYGIIIYILIKSNINKKLKIVLISMFSIIPILVGFSRVYLGAHYISDVIGSFIIGIALLLIEIDIIERIGIYEN